MNINRMFKYSIDIVLNEIFSRHKYHKKKCIVISIYYVLFLIDVMK